MARHRRPRELAALLLRGGTSKGVFFNEHSFPAVRSSVERDDLVRRCFGVPDKSGLQLDGLGGGISSTSKVVFVGASDRPGIDIEYDFGQVGILDGKIDWTGNCGNLSSALLLAAKQFRLIPEDRRRIAVWQVNVQEEMAVEEHDEQISIPGVPGHSSRVDVTFLGDPERSILPTGYPRDDIQGLPCTLIHGSNPTIFFPERVLHELDLLGKPDASFFAWMEAIRGEGSRKMGIQKSDALRVSFVRSPSDYMDSTGAPVRADAHDLFARITTPNRRFHHAFTGTGAVNLAMAAQIPGTIIHDQLVAAASSSRVRIGHPGGVMEVTASVGKDENGMWRGKVELMRTARLLFAGRIFA